MTSTLDGISCLSYHSLTNVGRNLACSSGTTSGLPYSSSSTTDLVETLRADNAAVCGEDIRLPVTHLNNHLNHNHHHHHHNSRQNNHHHHHHHSNNNQNHKYPSPPLGSLTDRGDYAAAHRIKQLAVECRPPSRREPKRTLSINNKG